ncbi:MAG TPA: arylsulfatase [Verrucomicrobium sp.]|nr:arylsulfatase [Verrucomicrobium sp.]
MKISLLTLFATVCCAAAQSERPNVVVMLVDDMGWSDIGCYGGELKTPNLDALAKDGVRFTQFYNAARCCPTRASLLTGLYPHQAGVGHMTEERRDDKGDVLPGYSGRLNDTSVTIPEVLGQAGYFTAMTGKWHVGQNFGVVPDKRGFQRTLTAAAGGFYFPEGKNARLFYNGAEVPQGGNEAVPKDWYSSDLWASFGLKFVDEAITAKKPFFLYTAFNAPHFPLQAPEEDIARWRGKFKTGWDKLREERYRRQIAAGLIDEKWPLSPRPAEVPAWDSLTPEQQDRYDHLMAIYAAVIEHMDRAVGQLVDGLKQRGQLDNTLILFLSDNGGNAEAGVQGRSNGKNLGSVDSDVFIGQCWATLNNTPFVRYKHYTDEGGISTPLIAHWPKGIPAERRGALEKQPGHLIDILATAVDVSGAEYPKEFNGKAITPKAGTSLLPAIKGEKLARSQPLFWEHEGNRAIRDGDLKLVALENQPWRLYDLATDRSEQNDLAVARPEVVKSLADKWQAWAADANVLPLGAWRGGRKKGQNRFSLKSGDHLDGEKAPDVAGRGFTITAKFEAADGDGVLIAHGGTVHGYSLAIHQGKLTFSVRRDGKITQVALPDPVTGPQTAVATLTSDGTASLAIGTKVATAKLSVLKANPKDGLDVGNDLGAAVGPYATAAPFKGKIDSVEIELSAK